MPEHSLGCNKMYNNRPCIAALIVPLSLKIGFCVSRRMVSATILIELNCVAFETTVLIRGTAVCVLSTRNGHFNGFLPFHVLKTHTTVHSVSDRANYLFVGLQGTSSTKPYTELIWWRHKRLLSVITLRVFPQVTRLRSLAFDTNFA